MSEVTDERRFDRVETAEILWGGPRGPGLVYTVAELGRTVVNLTTVVLGEDGLQGSMTSVKNSLDQLNDRNEKNGKFIERWGMPIVVILMLIGFSSLILLGRTISVVTAGKL